MLNILRFILSPLTFLYKYIIGIRNYCFDKNIFKQEFVKAKVISVGNLTFGGSGKTPLVINITKYLKENGKKVGVLSRGYGRTSKGFQLVSDGEKMLLNVKEAGDEIFLVSEECKVPTAVAEKRVIGANTFLSKIDLDILVLDDAFQHRWIGRDLDILMIEQRFLSNVNSFDQRLLPLGSMREPFDSITRADLILINRKFSPKINIPIKVKKHLSDKTIFYCNYKITGIFDVKTNKGYEVEDFEGQHSLVVCGIAKPFSFLRTLLDNDININNKIILPDHKEYKMKEIEKIRKQFYDTNSYSVLTTQKDAVKLMQFSKELDDIDIYYLKIDLELEEPEQFYKFLNNKIN
ncbi:MAG: tetraacyldisaccharide 4'-kinase [Melioribacteraceae bacterium]|nr:tetraacyldisaccharide 4'-kinase [Melioribacteraceae bacterium]